MKQLLIIAVFGLWLICQMEALLANNQPLALVTAVQGEGFVLRHPRLDRDQVRNPKAYSVIFFQGRYWDAIPLVNQRPLFYGDLILSKARSSISLSMQGNHEINMAEDSALQFIPDFIQILQGNEVRPELHLLAGQFRIFSRPSLTRGGLSVRTPSLLAELHQGNSLVAIKGKSSQLISIEGDAYVRRVHRDDRELHTQSVEMFRARRFQDLTRITNQRHRFGLAQPVHVATAYKIESWEDFNQHDIQQLNQLLGADKAKAYVDNINRFESFPAREADLRFYSFLLPDLDSILNRIDFHQLDELEDELFSDFPDLSESVSGERSKRLKKSDPLQRLFAFRLGYGQQNHQINSNFSLAVNALALELELRPWKYTYAYLAFASGPARTDGMTNFLGQGVPEPLNSYSQLSLGLGTRLVLWQRLAFSLGGALVQAQQLSIQYADTPSNVNRTYTLSMNPMMVGELGLSVSIFRNWELFLRYGQGQGQMLLEAKDISSRFRESPAISYGLIGLGWNAD